MNKSKDFEFNKIKELKWSPYIGDKYYDSDKKILFLGESHYHDNNLNSIKWNNKPTFTREIHSEFAIRKNDKRTKLFYNLNRALFRNNDRIDTNILWNKLAFYNFIQSSMNTNKSRPNKNDFMKGWSTYFKLIEILKPEFCLFIGTESSKYLEKAIKFSEYEIIKFEKFEKINNTFPREVKIKNIEGKVITLIFIKHTSQFFSWNEWNIFLKKEYQNEIEWLKKGIWLPKNTVGNTV